MILPNPYEFLTEDYPALTDACEDNRQRNYEYFPPRETSSRRYRYTSREENVLTLLPGGVPLVAGGPGEAELAGVAVGLTKSIGFKSNVVHLKLLPLTSSHPRKSRNG